MKKKFKALVANTGEDSLSYLDLENGEIIKIIDLKKQNYSYIGPYELVNKGHLIYCTNIYDNSIYKIDINNGEILDSLYIGSYPSCIKIFKKYFYIINTDSNSISIIDNESFSLIGNIPVGDRPMDMEIDQVKEKLYIANSNSRSISRIDLKNNEILNIVLENNPLKIILDEDQILVLSVISDSPIPKSSISLVDLESLEEKKFIEIDGIFNTIIKINSSEIIFATNIDNGYLYRMDIKKKNILSKTHLSGLPNKLVWDGDRTFYITNLSNNTLSLFDIDTNTIIKSFLVGKEPNGILLLD